MVTVRASTHALKFKFICYIFIHSLPFTFMVSLLGEIAVITFIILIIILILLYLEGVIFNKARVKR